MTRIVIEPSGKTLECEGNDTVLMALEKGGYALPNNCRAGACGECKVKVLSGEYDQGMVLDMALSEEERKQGCGLMCMAKPLSDEMVIEWGDADALPKLFPPRQGALFVVVDRRLLAERILELRLRPVGNPIRYWPGQYVRLGDKRNGIPLRAYSISNAPRPDGEIVLQISRQDDGITSNWLHNTVQLGDNIKVNGAYGTFIGDPSAETPVLCLAAGTGLAPILDLTEAALNRGYKKRVNLLYSARTGVDVYSQGMMAWWYSKYRNFNYQITLTREQQEGYLHGRITSIMADLYPDLSTYSVFIAGSPAFVDDCEQAARELGVQDELIHKEGFFVEQALAEG